MKKQPTRLSSATKKQNTITPVRKEKAKEPVEEKKAPIEPKKEPVESKKEPQEQKKSPSKNTEKKKEEAKEVQIGQMFEMSDQELTIGL